MFTIYALADPRTLRIRYIGMTQNHPIERMIQHWQNKKGEQCQKEKWIAELKAVGTKPTVLILQYVNTLDDARTGEKFWIKQGIDSGWPLANQAGGANTRRKYLQRKQQRPKTLSKPKIPPPNTGPTDLQRKVWAWRDQHPTGTQADLRRDFAAQEIAVSRGYVHHCWHSYAAPETGAEQMARMGIDWGNAEVKGRRVR
jgi:hypothetical protein